MICELTSNSFVKIYATHEIWLSLVLKLDHDPHLGELINF